MSIFSRLRKAVDPFGTQTENIIANPGGYLVGKIMKSGQSGQADTSAPPPTLSSLPTGANGLPLALQPRPVTYSQPPPDAGLLTQLAYRMAGTPPQPSGLQQPASQYGYQTPTSPQFGTQGLPMTDPYSLLPIVARMRAVM